MNWEEYSFRRDFKFESSSGIGPLTPLLSMYLKGQSNSSQVRPSMQIQVKLLLECFLSIKNAYSCSKAVSLPRSFGKGPLKLLELKLLIYQRKQCYCRIFQALLRKSQQFMCLQRNQLGQIAKIRGNRTAQIVYSEAPIKHHIKHCYLYVSQHGE